MPTTGNSQRACLGCSSPLSAPFLDLGETPLANALVSPERIEIPEPRFPLAVAYCERCHLVQLTDLVPPERLFDEYAYFSSFSETFLAHAREMADTLTERCALGPASRVLEIASNDGYLLQYFQAKKIEVLGIEPARNVAVAARQRGIPTLNRYFGLSLVPEVLGSFGRADLIIGNNVLAHVPGVVDFLKAVRACLSGDGVAVFEFPGLKDLLDQREFDTIYHEHVFYFSLSALKSVVEAAELQLCDVSREAVHGGSLRVFLRHAGEGGVADAVRAMLDDEQEAGLTSRDRYASFSREVVGLKEQLLALLRKLRASGCRVAAYGAPAKGATLLNYCGIGPDLVQFTVDRSPHKQGRLLPGVRIPIHHPDKIVECRPDYLLILPWNLKSEIIAQMAHIRQWRGKFIVPIPRAEIIA